VPVITAHVEQKPVSVVLAAVGAVEAISSVQIRAQDWAVEHVHFAEGQEVQQGSASSALMPGRLPRPSSRQNPSWR